MFTITSCTSTDLHWSDLSIDSAQLSLEIQMSNASNRPQCFMSKACRAIAIEFLSSTILPFIGIARTMASTTHLIIRVVGAIVLIITMKGEVIAILYFQNPWLRLSINYCNLAAHYYNSITFGVINGDTTISLILSTIFSQ